MIAHDLISMYWIKVTEYAIAVSFLILFVPFWRYLNADKAPATAVETVLPRLRDLAREWFSVPDHLYFHPGHAWVKPENWGVVTVGMDDFAKKMVGGNARLKLPSVGTRLGQGEKGWSLEADSKLVDMLSPVDGVVLEVNERVVDMPGVVVPDAYNEGWLLKVSAPRMSANLKQLYTGAGAKRWMADVCEDLQSRLYPELGLLSQDGGFPVDGMARSLDSDRWDEVARTFFLTGNEDASPARRRTASAGLPVTPDAS